MELRNATAIVTGGARGIGRGIALALAAEGANIIIGDLVHNEAIAREAAATTRQCEALGVKVLTVAVDVTQEQQCQQLVEAALNAFGRLDVVCANAGVISRAPIHELSVAEWDRIFAVNTRGVFLTCKAAARQFMAQRHGCFVTTASIAGKRATPGASHYGASKWAVIGFTQSLAMEMAPYNVRANAICPGLIGTNMWLDDILADEKARGEDTAQVFQQRAEERTPLKRPQTPADIGQAAVFLCKADNITGIALTVAGGIEMG